VRTLSFMTRVGLGPLVGICAGALGLLALARALPMHIEVDLESARSRSVSIAAFPAKGDAAQRMPEQVVEADVQRTIACALSPKARALALELGTEPGKVRVEAIRISRVLRWATWRGAALDQWKPKAGIERVVTKDGALELELSGVEPARLAHIAVAPSLKAGARREQTMAAIAGALLGVVLTLRTALHAWRSGSSNQRKLAVAYAGLCVLLVGLTSVAAKRVLGRGKRSGYQDLTGDYDLSLLDHFGRRASIQQGRLGMLLDPFTFYRNFPNQENGSLSTDENGFRGGIADDSKPFVFLLGGSTAFGYGLAHDDESISARMNVHLASFTTVNAGASGYVSGQELALLVSRIDAWRPAAYIVLNGWNDLMEAVYWPEHGFDPESPVLGVNGQYFHMESRLWEQAQRASDDQLPPWSFALPNNSPSLDARFERALEIYVTNVERMATWAQARGAVFLVALQPEKNAKRTLTETERKASAVTPEISAQYRRFVELAQERFEELGIHCLNLLDRPEIVDRPDDLFMDPCHLTPRGCDVVAGILAIELERLLASASKQ